MKSKAWAMYSNFHRAVSDLLEEDNLDFTFNPNDNPRGVIKYYDTNIVGKFECTNPSCGSSGWSSGKVAITIRLYPNERYNARVYNQRCKKCMTLGRPTIDENVYVERVVYRLKKWAGVKNLEELVYSHRNTQPHKSALCEGCKNGHCKAQSWDEDDDVVGLMNRLTM
ncbi:hypothetical protein K470DRAFT_259132 [Piedraia hortae CBS 480.64]|uniref:3CxxC-type domain-containing protein n=1 Tax=Piedraia hortae CBS 480.64 TaxID=1314780 RepID=A0A6A7BVD6_9PEZI|nr:hypothetical protein K470DRAFT_259132 [Piedraia hortae CBS 480.64]